MDADQERREIRAAMDRLLTGRPFAHRRGTHHHRARQEADVNRHLLTHRHTDLRDEFNARVSAQHHVPPRLAAAHDQNKDYRGLDAALDDQRVLREQVHALARRLNLLVAEIDTTQRRGSTTRTLTKLP